MTHAPRRAGRRRFIARAAAGAVVAAVAARRPASGAPVLSFRLAHNIPIAHPTHRRLQEAADTLRRESGGRIAIDVFPASQLGGETDLLGQLRSGAIDFLPLSATTLQTLVPVAGINGLAFVFDDLRSVWNAMDGAVGAHVRSAVEAENLHAFDRMLDNGFRHVTTARRPIRTVADLEGLKIRVPVSPLHTSMFKALGALPTSINFAELYTALQTGLVDAEENPLVVIEVGKLHEVQRCCSLTGHMWDGHWLLANGTRWRGLPADVRDRIDERMTEAILRQRADIVRLDADLGPRLGAEGMAFNAPPTRPFRRALERAGFYAAWRSRFDPAAIGALERCCGRLG